MWLRQLVAPLCALSLAEHVSHSQRGCSLILYDQADLRGLMGMQVTVALLEQGEFVVVSQINNALVGAGYLKESADIAGEEEHRL